MNETVYDRHPNLIDDGKTINGEVVKNTSLTDDDSSTTPYIATVYIGTDQNLARIAILKGQSAKIKYSSAQIAAIVKEFKLSKLNIDDYCKQINTPSPVTLRKWLKMDEKACPECQSLKLMVATLEAKLSVYEKGNFSR